MISDVASNRKSKKWSRGEQAKRLLWSLCEPAFSWSPRPLWGWRRFLLRSFGASVGDGAHIYPSARITMPWNLSCGEQCAIGDHAIIYALGPIHIGARTTISQYAHLCAGTHDARDPAKRLLKPPIHVADDVWICASAFIGPGVEVGRNSIVGACAVVMRDVPEGETVVGNPGRPLNRRRAPGSGSHESEAEKLP